MWDHCGKRPGLTTNVEWNWMIMLFLFSAIYLVMFGSSLWTLPSDFTFPLSFPGTYLLPSLPLQDSSGTLCWLVLQPLFSLPTLSCKAANAHACIPSFLYCSWAEHLCKLAITGQWDARGVLGTSGKQRETPEESPLPIHLFLPALDIAMYGNDAWCCFSHRVTARGGTADARKVAERWRGPTSFLTSLSKWTSTGTSVSRPLSWGIHKHISWRVC